MEKEQKYEGRDISVCFDAERCIHAGNCVRGLPDVFRANQKGAWIFPDEADAAALAALIETCPSGALTYTRPDGTSEKPPAKNSARVERNGPINLHANYSLNGQQPDSWRASLCRCGASRNKPFCDGSHGMAGFRDSGEIQPFKADTELAAGSLDVKAMKNGPLYIEGPLYICDSEGKIARIEKKIALCRCGASKNKPFCDGSHAAIGFKSD